MSSVIEADLARSGLIKTVNASGLPRSGELSAVQFTELKTRGADAAVIGAVQSGAGGMLNISFRLVDVPKQTQLTAKKVSSARGSRTCRNHQVAFN